ncbi:MAG: hypothetical protein IT453_05625 [Planctomycetes bacterium]|nr:hypothetical protein [Planctomycetota bacterium]
MVANGARWILRMWVVFGACLLTLAVFVRSIGLRGGERSAPELATPTIPEPMQLLSRSAATRIDARWLWIEPERRERWERCFRRPFEIRDCPRFADWLATPDGAETALLIGELTHGKAEEALTSLSLIFELARRTAWKVGVLDSSTDATELARLLETWLSTWAPTSSRDPLLAEPTRVAFALWARITSAAVDAPFFGTDEAAASHARVFADSLTRARAAAATDFGRALAEHSPRAFALLLQESDFLVGLAEDAARLYPEIDGSCGS